MVVAVLGSSTEERLQRAFREAVRSESVATAMVDRSATAAGDWPTDPGRWRMWKAVANATDWGAAQARKRKVLFGTRSPTGGPGGVYDGAFPLPLEAPGKVASVLEERENIPPETWGAREGRLQRNFFQGIDGEPKRGGTWRGPLPGAHPVYSIQGPAATVRAAAAKASAAVLPDLI